MRKSAGVLLYRRESDDVSVMLLHPGGPYWARRDLGAWSIPKGEYDEPETPEAAARREFFEETGLRLGAELQPLGEVRQSGSKRVVAFAAEGDCDPDRLSSNEFRIEWPPHSGQLKFFPEIDRGEWFPLALARDKIVAGQRPFLDRLEAQIAEADPSEPAAQRAEGGTYSSSSAQGSSTTFPSSAER